MPIRLTNKSQLAEKIITWTCKWRKQRFDFFGAAADWRIRQCRISDEVHGTYPIKGMVLLFGACASYDVSKIDSIV